MLSSNYSLQHNINLEIFPGGANKAQMTKNQEPKGRGREGLWEHSKLSTDGWGGAPETKRVFCNSSSHDGFPEPFKWYISAVVEQSEYFNSLPSDDGHYSSLSVWREEGHGPSRPPACVPDLIHSLEILLAAGLDSHPLFPCLQHCQITTLHFTDSLRRCSQCCSNPQRHAYQQHRREI